MDDENEKKPQVLVVGPKHGRTALLALLAANMDARLLDFDAIPDRRLPELPPLPELPAIDSMSAFPVIRKTGRGYTPPPPTKKAEKARAKSKAARRARRKSR